MSKLLTILQQIPFLFPWIGGREGMVLRLWKVVQMFCSPLRKIFPRISVHDLIKPWGNVRVKFPWTKQLFHSPGRSLWFVHTSSVSVHFILTCLTFSLSATQINMVEEGCWFYQINVFHKHFSALGQCFVCVLPVLYPSTHTDKNGPFLGLPTVFE